MSRIIKLIAALGMAALLSTGVLAGAAAAQYEPTPPGIDPGVSVEELLAVINANAAAEAAVAAAASGDAAGAQAYVGVIEGLLADFPNNAAIQNALATADAAARSARQAAAAPASVPAAVAAAPANLAFTGNEVSLPVTAGAILIGAGGLLLLAANKRSTKD